MLEKAQELGRIISQLPEYAYLRAARREIDEDRDATALPSHPGRSSLTG